ncbi:MAG: peptidoglycan DL-endopeptidase CwlO, partial [Thermoleophilaceae bacterium]|nr:peptidoglycan DL-endopeptidase CwlO [Thermoleophilaceae bacterium]
MRRIVLVLAIAAALFPQAATASTRANWDKSEQRTVQNAGVLQAMPDGDFHGADPLTADQFDAALSAFAHRIHRKPVAAVAGTRVTVAVFHKLVVKQVGLADLARNVQAEAKRAGLAPPSRFGNEVVARQLGLRFNHPSQDDALELFPGGTITRAEAAYSFARLLSKSSGSYGYVRQLLDQFVLPAYTQAQMTALHVAVSKIGMPYIWGGESDTTSSKYGPQAHGGYDCSGFVWRVFKLSGDPAGAGIKGRTAAQMGGEIPRSGRVSYSNIAPTDLVFFGSPIYHVGIAMSDKFIIQSSNQGV